MGTFTLRNVWVAFQATQFAATWTKEASQGRLDRFYFTPSLMARARMCSVLPLPVAASCITDHRPVLLELAFPTSPPRQVDFWRLDVGLLSDEQPVLKLAPLVWEYLPESLRRPEKWDALKNKWCSLVVSAGRARRGRVSVEHNRILQRLRLVRSIASTALLMREFMVVLRAPYNRLLAHSSTTAGEQRLTSVLVTDPEVQSRERVLDAGIAAEVSRARLHDDSYNTSPGLVANIFRSHFAAL